MNEVQINYLDRGTKRFLAAAMIMQGMAVLPMPNGFEAATEARTYLAVYQADALLKELEKTK